MDSEINWGSTMKADLLVQGCLKVSAEMVSVLNRVTKSSDIILDMP